MPVDPPLGYDAFVRSFDPDTERREVLGKPGSPVNAATVCCDRHGGQGRVGLYYERRNGTRGELTFDALRERSERCARLLIELGVRPGDCVAGLLPRIPELVVLALAAWRLGAVYQPLFTAFGPKAIDHRLAGSGARIVVTDRDNQAKLAEINSRLDAVIVVGGAASGRSALDFDVEVDRRPAGLIATPCMVDDPFLIMFTSGTTGPAKALTVPIAAIASFAVYMRHAVGLTPGDRFWNIADPGWAYGLYYGVVGPLAIGRAPLLVEAPFTVRGAVETIATHRITNLAGAPTAYRMMMASPPETFASIRGRLRAVSSAGEPLNAEVIRWFAKELEAPIRDHYGQTETGMVLCNHHGLDHPVQPGAAGFALPGFRVAVIDEAGVDLPPGRPGRLVVDRRGSPLLWFGGYRGDPFDAGAEPFHITGDTAEMNEDGSISFVGREDDVITSSGYRIGPFDVESALIEHDAVAEAAVIGKPDRERTEIVKAFVVLMPGVAASEHLAEELRLQVRRRLSAHAYPREIAFVDDLPKTPSGKIQRFLLRARERNAD